jgi:AcrR family transcriptional regulator
VQRTAARLFQAAGYSGTTMADIATEVGVLPGSLYHHFESKEDIAVALLLSFERELEEFARAETRKLRDSTLPPDAVVAELGADLTEVTFRHAAAVRLRAFPAPPSVATERFTAAMRVRTPALDRLWQKAAAGLAATTPPPAADVGLLRFVLQRLSLYAPAWYVNGPPRVVAGELSDALFGGMVVDCPDDETLNHSPAFAAVQAAMATWPSRQRSEPLDDREGIVASARAEFARRGYEATTIRDIAGAAGVGMGRLYRRVEGKEALLREILESYSAHLEDALNALTAAGSSVPEALDALAAMFVRASRLFREEFAIVSHGWGGEYESAGKPLHEYWLATERRFSAIEKLITAGLDQGALRAVAPGRAETTLHLRSVLWQPYHEHARTSEARAHQFVRDSLLRGALRGGR